MRLPKTETIWRVLLTFVGAALIATVVWAKSLEVRVARLETSFVYTERHLQSISTDVRELRKMAHKLLYDREPY